MGQRHQSRVTALKLLYGLDIKHELEQCDKAFLSDLISYTDLDVSDFAQEILLGITSDYQKIDNLITDASSNWKIDRMGIIDRNIIRIGAYEMLAGEPAPIVINEAILLARNFGSENSTAFVNGILDQIRNILHKE